MKKTKLLYIGITAVFLAASPMYVFAQEERGRPGDEHKGRLASTLNLTEEQQQKLEVNRKAQRQEMEKLFTAMKDKQKQLQEQLASPAVTQETVTPIANELKSIQAQLIDHRISGILAVKEILTPEQFAKFHQMMEEGKRDRKGRIENFREKRKERRMMERAPDQGT
ncbi:MAG: Spy/CpxP family protein refolding chaperone [Candidatus Omnitrophica bacterium]|nr:Spy/CpxP family protein refolding chaperone [Candidatus Omnitrophota bacterium]